MTTRRLNILPTRHLLQPMFPAQLNGHQSRGFPFRVRGELGQLSRGFHTEHLEKGSRAREQARREQARWAQARDPKHLRRVREGIPTRMQDPVTRMQDLVTCRSSFQPAAAGRNPATRSTRRRATDLSYGSFPCSLLDLKTTLPGLVISGGRW